MNWRGFEFWFYSSFYLTRIRKKALRSGEGRGVEGEGSGGVEARNYCWDLQVVFQFCFSFSTLFCEFHFCFQFQLWVSVPGGFLKIVCVLQFRRSVSGCGFSVSVNCKQFGSWVFQFCAIWDFNSVSVSVQSVSTSVQFQVVSCPGLG